MRTALASTPPAPRIIGAAPTSRQLETAARRVRELIDKWWPADPCCTGFAGGVGVSKPRMSIQENLMRRCLLAVASSVFLLAAAFLPAAAVHAAEYPTGPISRSEE